MQLLVFSWPWALSFWLVFLWVFAPELLLVGRSRAASRASASQDKGSLQLIAVAQPLATILAFSLPASWQHATAFAHPRTALVCGLVLMVAAGLLRRHCKRVLGEHFTGAVVVEPGHPLVDRGAYRWVRHPSYTAGIAIFAGIGLALGNWAAVALLTLTCVGAYAYRVAVEERALLLTLGEPYAEFMRTRKRFIPFLV